jgi:hypothetical protein
MDDQFRPENLHRKPCVFFAKSRGLSGEGAPDYINLLSIGI